MKIEARSRKVNHLKVYAKLILKHNDPCDVENSTIVMKVIQFKVLSVVTISENLIVIGKNL